MGIPSYTFNNEWPLYVLEAVPMLFALSVLGWFHPGRWLLQPIQGNQEEEDVDLESRKSKRKHRSRGDSE